MRAGEAPDQRRACLPKRRWKRSTRHASGWSTFTRFGEACADNATAQPLPLRDAGVTRSSMDWLRRARLRPGGCSPLCRITGGGRRVWLPVDSRMKTSTDGEKLNTVGHADNSVPAFTAVQQWFRRGRPPTARENAGKLCRAGSCRRAAPFAHRRRRFSRSASALLGAIASRRRTPQPKAKARAADQLK